MSVRVSQIGSLSKFKGGLYTISSLPNGSGFEGTISAIVNVAVARVEGTLEIALADIDFGGSVELKASHNLVDA